MTNKNKYVIGIDVGTTVIKGNLFTVNGKYISSSKYKYYSHSPKICIHEQNPDDWISGIIKIMDNLIINEDIRNNLVALSLSTQGGTVIPVDKDYRPLTQAITWLDRRAEHLIEQNNELKKWNNKFYRRTGWRLDSNMFFLPVYWLKKIQPQVFNKIHKVFSVNDYILHTMTGNNIQDPSNASITLFYNVKKREWDKEILDLIGLKRANFSEVKDSGEIVGFLFGIFQDRYQFRHKVKVINGGHDQYCAALGCGIINEKEILLSSGTAWVLFKLIKDPLFDLRSYFASGRGIIKEKYGLICPIPAAGVSLDWFSSKILNLKKIDELFELIEKNKDAFDNIKNDILFYPYLIGIYGPDFNVHKRASFQNIFINHSRLDLIKAIIEGLAFQSNKIIKNIRDENNEVEKIKMVGGSTKSLIIPQIVADVINKEILIPKDSRIDFAAKGAAILATYGSGYSNSIIESYKLFRTSFKKVKPNNNNINFYRDKFNKFLKEDERKKI